MNENDVNKFSMRRSISRSCKDTAIARMLVPLTSDNISPVKPRRAKSTIVRKSAVKIIKSKEDSTESESEKYSESSDESTNEESEESIDSIEIEKENVKLQRKSTILSKNRRKTITVPIRQNACKVVKDDIIKLQERLHVSSVPTKLPCREVEFDSIYSRLESRISLRSSGCMFISGLPGTGKTATVTSVLDHLEKVYTFNRVEINGMQISEAKQLYSTIYSEITGKRIHLKKSCEALRSVLFNAKAPTTVVVIDELDQLFQKKQDVLYTIFNWPVVKGSKLMLIGIANTMDLPERVLQNKIVSRIGISKVPFESYSQEQLIEIISMRIGEENIKYFESQAVEFVAKKVAASLGDARLALDICRRGLDLRDRNNGVVSSGLIGNVIKEMFTSPMWFVVQNNLSIYEKIFLKILLIHFRQTGLEEAIFSDLKQEILRHCNNEGYPIPSIAQLYSIAQKLTSMKIINIDSFTSLLKTKVKLNCSIPNLNFALEQSKLS